MSLQEQYHPCLRTACLEAKRQELWARLGLELGLVTPKKGTPPRIVPWEQQSLQVCFCLYQVSLSLFILDTRFFQ